VFLNSTTSPSIPYYLPYNGSCGFSNQVKLYELNLNSTTYEIGTLIGFQSVLLPTKKYHIQIEGFCSSGTPQPDYFLKLYNNPIVNSSIFTNFYFWKIAASAGSSVVTNSITTIFPIFSILGGIKLSSPPIINWINLN
jgi:hypothetical protein